MRKFFILVLIMVLSACSTKQTDPSYTDQSLSSNDVVIISSDITNFIANEFPPAKTTLIINSAGEADPFANALIADLKNRGFAVATPPTNAVGVNVQYYITKYQGGILLRVNLNNFKVGSMYYAYVNNKLTPATGFSKGVNDGNE